MSDSGDRELDKQRELEAEREHYGAMQISATPGHYWPVEKAAIDSALVHRLQVTAAIDALEQYCDALTDEGADKFLEIKYRLVKQLEES